MDLCQPQWFVFDKYTHHLGLKKILRYFTDFGEWYLFASFSYNNLSVSMIIEKQHHMMDTRLLRSGEMLSTIHVCIQIQ